MSAEICIQCLRSNDSERETCAHCGATLEFDGTTKPVGQALQELSPTHEVADALENKKVTPLLTIGILFFPYIFAWITLQQGYSTRARVFSFIYTILIIIGAVANDSFARYVIMS